MENLSHWVGDGKYLSHDIINELMEMMANSLLCNLLSEIKESEWYTIIADETRDSSGKEQLTVSIRWVDKYYHVKEDLIGLIHDCGSQCRIIRDALHLVSDLSNLIRASPKRLAIFAEIRDSIHPGGPSISHIAPLGGLYEHMQLMLLSKATMPFMKS
uniref:DUF4371 domain-containing protein n=1 Tax=Amphimedon queenslandica TaxID=400682 RepID=A0A1X7V6I5_AMPQE